MQRSGHGLAPVREGNVIVDSRVRVEVVLTNGSVIVGGQAPEAVVEALQSGRPLVELESVAGRVWVAPVAVVSVGRIRSAL